MTFVRVFEEPKGLPTKQPVEFETRLIDLEEASFKSMLGTPVFSQIEFEAGRYFELDDIKKENPIKYEGIILQTVLAEVTQTKNIITTSIQGRDGTVKEYISKGDFLITITGGVIGETIDGIVTDINGFYPEVDVRRLAQICEIPDAVTVTSEFLEFFNIREVVITDYNFAQLQGTRDFQPFQITMLSDSPIQLNELVTPRIINIQTRVPAEPILVDRQLTNETT